MNHFSLARRPRLRPLLASLLAVLVLAACAPGLPLVVVDEAHFTAFKQGVPEDNYKLRPSTGFTLDATGYPFLLPAEAPEVIGPNMIQLSASDGQVYSHAWDMALTRYELTPENLVNLDTGTAFPGLVAGESYLLGVGHLDATGRFTVLWAAILNVQAN